MRAPMVQSESIPKTHSKRHSRAMSQESAVSVERAEVNESTMKQERAANRRVPNDRASRHERERRCV